MTTPATVIPTRYSIPLLLALIAAGLAGNYFNFEIFLNINFLFGSIFAMLALQLFGFGRGILAAAAIAGYTYILWKHPYAIVIMTAEVAVVGWLMTRRKVGMVLADALYWLVIGMPLVYLFYHLVMHVPPSNTYIVMYKQALNGIANALVARLIFTGYALVSRSSQISFREMVYNLLSFFVLCPALILLAVSSRSDFKETDWNIRTSLTQTTHRLDNFVDTWVLNRQKSIITLAEMAASRSPQQMQLHLEQTKRSDTNFLRVGLLDREATITAYFPLLDELGHSSIGISAADRPYLPILKQSLKPMLSDVVMGKVGTPKPRVFMLAPVVIQGKFSGYTIGVMDLEQVRIQLDKSLAENGTLYTLLDKTGAIILTSHPDQKQMSPLVRGEGTLNRLDTNISQWIPKLPPNIPISERWKRSLYITEAEVGDFAEWKLILEQPIAPFQKKLYDNYTGKLTLLFMILLGALALAELLSRRFAVTLEQLAGLTRDLPVRLATDGKVISWPESGIQETNYLINNFKEMADSLSGQLNEVRQINETLELRVQERTNELGQANELLELTGEMAMVGGWELDLTTTLVTYSKIAARIHEFDLPYMPPKLSQGNEYYPPEAWPIIQTAVQAAIEHGTAYDLESPFITAKGRHIWVRVQGLAVRESGKTIKLRGTIQDITERKYSDIKFQTLFNLMPQPLSMSDGSGNIVYQNQNFNDTFGYTLQELPTIETWMLKAYPDEVYRTSVITQWSKSVQDSIENRTSILPKEYAVTCKDGTVRTVLISGIELGEGSLLVMCVDITERKQMEIELQRSERSLYESQEAGRVGSYIFDIQRDAWSSSAVMDEIFGIGLDYPRTLAGWTQIIHPDEQEPINAYFNEIITEHRPFEKEYRIVRINDGSERWVAGFGKIEYDVNGVAILMAGIVQDISKRKQVEIDLLKAKAAADSANTTKSQFLANMSHEIRTPMNGVLDMTQLLEMTELTAEQREYVEALKLSGKNLLSLISDILDLSKIEAGKIIIETAEFSLHQSINDIVLMQKTVAYEKSLALDLNLSKGIPPLLVGDQLRIKQILLNLLGNAVKFTSQGSVAISTQLLEQHDNFALIQIAVRDSGIGISPESLDTIFKPFIQEDGSISRKFGGTGLGLTISLRLAELMGGTIGVESTPGVGSCFTVTLPFSIGRETATSQPATSITTAGWDGPPMRILYAEDDQVNIKFGSVLLKKMGLDVVVVENGRECLSALEHSTFDLVLMDIQMPVMTGEEALREIRSKEQGTTDHQPVIALTAYSMRGDEERFLGDGFDGYVSKPLITRELVAEMKRVMGLSSKAMEEIHG